MNLVPAEELSYAELAALFTRGYEGYFVPIVLDEAALRTVVDLWDIDLARSRAVPGQGVAFLAARGGRGWIAGLGVVPEARRRGIGRALMEAVLADAPAVVTLEVIEQNEPAIRLYEELGFVRRRVLEVWSLTADVPLADARAADPRPLGQADLPWQRADESLPAEYERIEVDGGAALFRAAAGRVNVLQLEARDEAVAAQLVRALRHRGDSLHYVNVPEGDPAAAALESLGAQLDLRQFELQRAS